MLSLSSISLDDYFIFISVFRLVFSYFFSDSFFKIIMDFILTYILLYISKGFLSNAADLNFFLKITISRSVGAV